MSDPTSRRPAHLRAAALAWLASAAAASALSLELDAKLAFESYVLHEPIVLSINVRNQGGTPYIVDDYSPHEQNSIRITMRSIDDGILDSPEGNTVYGKLMVMPNESQSLEIPLDSKFPLAKLGRYHVQASLVRGEEVVVSSLMAFTVVNGIEIGSMTRPLPEYDTVARKYTLLYWPRDQIEVLFLRIDELPVNQCVGLIQLGNVVRYVEPRIEFDPAGELDVIHQSSRDLFIRTRIRSDRNGLEVLERQRLLDPNQSPMARSMLLRQEAATEDSEPGKDGFTRRVRPGDTPEQPTSPAPDAAKESGAPAADQPRRTLR